MADLFLSYAQTDRGFAERLAQELKKQGVRTWLDMSEIKPGESILERLRKELDDAHGVVIVLSDAALDSSNVMFELGAADALGKPIMAVRPAGTSLSGRPPVALSADQIVQGEGRTEGEIATALRSNLVA